MIDTKLEKLLNRLILPLHRKSKFNKNNLIWLSKNLAKTNKDSLFLASALEEINFRINNKIYTN